MMMFKIEVQGWKPGAWMCATEHGKVPVAGWVNGLFGLSFMVCETDRDSDELKGCWGITHIPTGYRAGMIYADLHKATIIADEIAALPSGWDFSVADMAASRSEGVRKVRGRHPEYRLSAIATYGPAQMTRVPA